MSQTVIHAAINRVVNELRETEKRSPDQQLAADIECSHVDLMRVGALLRSRDLQRVRDAEALQALVADLEIAIREHGDEDLIEMAVELGGQVDHLVQAAEADRGKS